MARRRDTDSPTPTPARRNGKPFHRASRTARAALTRVASSAGFAEADVLMRWAEIVGADLAPRCRPVKVTYGGKKSLGATLVVQSDSGRAPEVEHLSPAIIQRVNQFYGYRAISRIRISQSSIRGGFAEGQSAFQGPDATPTAAELETAERMAEGVQSAGLRAALSRMGANVLAQARTKPTSDNS
ncbi:MAG: DciA family protein [Pseudomonadota bacterium]